MSAPRDDQRAPALRCAELYLPSDETNASVHDRAEAQRSLVATLERAEPPDWAELTAAVDILLLEADAQHAAQRLQTPVLRPSLVYIDPPYASHREYIFAQTHPVDGSRVERVAFSDRWDGGLDAYVDALAPVIEAIYVALQDEGSFLLHVDPRGSPYLSVRCDRIFGMGARLAKKHAPGFRNELVWSYGLGGSSPREWPKKHDTILWYTKGSGWYFEPPMIPATSNRMRGQLKKQPDVIEIPSINNMARDRTGYPTQKPLELLELLVGAHSEASARVADLFSGSGTTALAAARLGRQAIAADISSDAIAVARTRLVAAGFSVAVLRPEADGHAPPQALDEGAVVDEREGAVLGGCFVVGTAHAVTHVLRRDIEGRERVGMVPR